jgi:hypothetical protein
MTPTPFPEQNAIYGPPPDLEESQCRSIFAWHGQAMRGSCEGAKLIVVAWKPDERELEALIAGRPVFLSMLSGLMPHFLTTNFQEATNPA